MLMSQNTNNSNNRTIRVITVWLVVTEVVKVSA